jgi:CBS domain-containing protein
MADEAVRIMVERNAGALVVNQGGRVVGIISERDLVRKVAGHRLRFEETSVASVMTKDVLYLRPEQTIDEAMAIMVNKGIRHLPVMDQDALAGLVSVRDLVKEVMDDRDLVISQLENYIRGH